MYLYGDENQTFKKKLQDGYRDGSWVIRVAGARSFACVGQLSQGFDPGRRWDKGFPSLSIATRNGGIGAKRWFGEKKLNR